MFSQIYLKFSLHVAVFACLLSASASYAQKCAAPDAETHRQVTDYVLQKYHYHSPDEISITESKQVNDACYWHYRFHSEKPQKDISLYLSPDRKFLSASLFDLHDDPQAEEKAAQVKAAKDLIGGLSPETGNASAPITIVLFSDFQCPYCKRFADMLEKEYLPGNSQQVRVRFKNYPLSFHAWSMNAAEMASCVTLQRPDEFWKIHDYLFENQSRFSDPGFKEDVFHFVSEKIAVDQKQYRQCVDYEMTMGIVKQDQELGQRLGVHATPSFFINGIFFSGIKSADQLHALVEEISQGKIPASGSAPRREAIRETSPAGNSCGTPSRTANW